MGAIFWKSHLLQLGVTADIQTSEHRIPSTTGVHVAERAPTGALGQNRLVTDLLPLWDNGTTSSISS